MKKMLMMMSALMLLMMPVTAHADDDDPLAELAELGDSLASDGPEAGGSIRARKDADNKDLNRRKDVKNIQAKVVMVNKSDFPRVALKVKIQKPACQPAKKGEKAPCAVAADQNFKANDEIVVIPVMDIKGGVPNMKDPTTMINAGAFYLRDGDKVVVRLKAKKGKVWYADYVERN